jgi:Fe-S-cluster-containing dehydrogenase component
MSSVDAPWNRIGEMGRRRFLKLLGTSLAMAGLSGCARFRAPSEALPYVHPPVNTTPGGRQFFATALPYRGYGLGAVVESVMGRPIKVDGNPDHPAVLGGSDAGLQAALLDLYDPDRPRRVSHRNAASTTAALYEMLGKHAERFQQNGGAGLHLLTEPLTSPSLQQTLTNLFPEAKWHRYGPFAGRAQEFEEPVQVQYNLAEADLILSFGEDFLGAHPNKLRYARDYARKRDPANGMSQLWVVETTPTLTGANADRLHRTDPAEVERIVLAITEGRFDDLPAALQGLEKELARNRGRTVILGPPARVHALNERYGNLGHTVYYTEAADRHPETEAVSLAQLRDALEADRVELLLILGGDPVYTSGGQLLPERAKETVHLTWRINQTSTVVDWVVPRPHPLEAWGDLRAYDGTVSLVQPLIEPLHQSVSVYQLLGALKGDWRTAYQQVRDYWRSHRADSEEGWEEWLRGGTIPGTTLKRVEAVPEEAEPGGPSENGMVAVFRSDPYFDAGESINNPWLLELGRPLTRLAWQNVVTVGEKWAKDNHVKEGDLLRIRAGERVLTAPAYPQKGQPEQVVTLTLGWGQQNVGRFGSDRGYDAFTLRGFDHRDSLPVEVEKAGEREALVSTQKHHRMEGRDLVRHADLKEWEQDSSLKIPEPPDESLYPEKKEAIRRWGMVVDLSKCIGCNACVAACGAENNLSVVGPEETAKGRAMHWIRVDHYNEERELFQPVPCMHCENAPCEQVCPVEATLHNEEGLNQMVYNRCVGTRYCSNNCPYKVRRFNFLDYSNEQIEEWKMVRNPEVTVRSRGVMEKCTYCVQRIEAADIQARIEERGIADGEVVTACQAACPTRAIVFGDLADPESEVSRVADLPHNYGMLAELNTRPRTTYLARISNQEGDA